MTGMRCFSISSSRKFRTTRLGVLERALQAVLLLLGGEVGREEEDRQLAVLLERVGDLAELLADDVELVVLLGDLEQRARVDLGDLLHGSSAPPSVSLAESVEKSSSPRASSTRRRWSSSVERLARDLLGRQDGEVGDLVADLLDRAPRLGLDVAARLLQQLLALVHAPPRASRARCSSAALRARATISSACSRASRSRSRYSVEQLVGLGLRALGGRRSTPRSPSGACRAPPGSAGRRACAGSRG